MTPPIDHKEINTKIYSRELHNKWDKALELRTFIEPLSNLKRTGTRKTTLNWRIITNISLPILQRLNEESVKVEKRK